jgi:hypothetical protein
MTASNWLVPIALLLGVGCSSNDEEAVPGGGNVGTPGGTNGSGGTVAGGRGGSSGSSAAGGTAGTGSGGSGGSAGNGGAGSGGSAGVSGAGGAGGSLTFQCADAAPNVEAPPATWVNATGNLAGMDSECGNLGLVSANPCSTMVIAGVAQAGLWATEDGGKNWSKLGSGAGSAEITNRISAIVYDPAHPGTFWESGIYNGGGVYKTTDNGKTFEQLGDVTHNDSVSVDFSDPDRKTLLAGPHEQTSKLSRSTDGGQTWTDVGKSLPGSAGYCVGTQVLSATNLLVGCLNGGVFHSSDGNAWTSLATKGVTPQPLLATDGAIYWPGSQGGINVSSDGGRRFTETVDGSVAPSIVGSLYPAELPDGRIVILGRTHLLISADKGKTFEPIGEPLPYEGGGYNGARGPAYSARTKTFYIWRWDCGDQVLPDAIMSAGFDYTKQ